MDSRLKQHHFGFWQVINQPAPHELQKYYADKYYQKAEGSYEIDYTQEELRYFQAKLEQRWAVLQRYRGFKPGRMLDVGCGEGYALAFFKEKNWCVKGFDYSSEGVSSKNPELKEALICGDVFQLLDEEIANGEEHDVVWLQNVLEHVLDPVGLLKSLRSLVAPEGLAVVTVPNDFSVVQLEALSGGHIESNFWVDPPEHLSYFDSESLSQIALATGWECVEILGDFPVDWFLFCHESNYIQDKKLGKAVHRARVNLENLVHTRPVDEVVNFWSALAKIGMGRNLTAFLRPTKKGAVCNG